MTHIIKSRKSIISTNSLQKSTNDMFRAEVNHDGELIKKDGRFKQWYVQMHIPGLYRVVHNLNRLDYGVSAAAIMGGFSVETSNLTDVSFDVVVLKAGERVRAPFKFTLNVAV